MQFWYRELLTCKTYRVKIWVLSSSAPAILGDHFSLLHLQARFHGKCLLLLDLDLYLIFFSSFSSFIGFVDLPTSRRRFMTGAVSQVAVLAVPPGCAAPSPVVLSSRAGCSPAALPVLAALHRKETHLYVQIWSNLVRHFSAVAGVRLDSPW